MGVNTTILLIEDSNKNDELGLNRYIGRNGFDLFGDFVCLKTSKKYYDQVFCWEFTELLSY